jgi:hypothetical protein
VHLADADALRNFGLRQAFYVSELQDRPFAGRESGQRRRQERPVVDPFELLVVLAEAVRDGLVLTVRREELR